MPWLLVLLLGGGYAAYNWKHWFPKPGDEVNETKLGHSYILNVILPGSTTATPQEIFNELAGFTPGMQGPYELTSLPSFARRDTDSSGGQHDHWLVPVRYAQLPSADFVQRTGMKIESSGEIQLPWTPTGGQGFVVIQSAIFNG